MIIIDNNHEQDGLESWSWLTVIMIMMDFNNDHDHDWLQPWTLNNEHDW